MLISISLESICDYIDNKSISNAFHTDKNIHNYDMYTYDIHITFAWLDTRWFSIIIIQTYLWFSLPVYTKMPVLLKGIEKSFTRLNLLQWEENCTFLYFMRYIVIFSCSTVYMVFQNTNLSLEDPRCGDDVSNVPRYHDAVVGVVRWSQIARLMGQHGAHLGPVGPRWAPCRPHEPCY